MAKHEAAFPYVMPDGGGEDGMTLRDWFAGQALPSVITATSAGQHQPGEADDPRPLLSRMAADAYKLADAMLAERSKP